MRIANLAIAAAALGAACLYGPAARAQDQPNDVKCLLVSNLYAKAASEEKARTTALQASFFYLGRMTGSADAVKARMLAEAKTLAPESSAATMEACAQAMVARAEQFSGTSEARPTVQGR